MKFKWLYFLLTIIIVLHFFASCQLTVNCFVNANKELSGFGGVSQTAILNKDMGGGISPAKTPQDINRQAGEELLAGCKNTFEKNKADILTVVAIILSILIFVVVWKILKKHHD